MPTGRETPPEMPTNRQAGGPCLYPIVISRNTLRTSSALKMT
jgi:hypothetical protein